jgi:hypothetical protein
MTVVPSASRLNFVASARSAFDFVTEPPYSLWLTDQDEGRVTYSGDDLGFAILHGRLSYELDLAVWRESVQLEVTHPYTIMDLIRAEDPGRARSYRQFSAASEAAVRRGLAILVSDFRRYGLPALYGTSEFYEQLRVARSRNADEFGLELTDKISRERAERAWKERDYAKVISQYAALNDRMSQAEIERVRYARRRVSEGSE